MAVRVTDVFGNETLLYLPMTSQVRVKDIYMDLIGVGQAVDVVVVTPEDVERYRDCPALIIEPALREGKVVYGS